MACLLAGAAVAATFVYRELSQTQGSRACGRLAQLDDHQLVVAFARFANDYNPTGHIVLGRKTDAELCSLAVDSLAHSLAENQYSHVVSCVAAAPSKQAARACF